MDEYKDEEDAIGITTDLGLKATEARKNPEKREAIRAELARVRRNCEALIAVALGGSSESEKARNLNMRIIEIVDRIASEVPRR